MRLGNEEFRDLEKGITLIIKSLDYNYCIVYSD